MLRAGFIFIRDSENKNCLLKEELGIVFELSKNKKGVFWKGLFDSLYIWSDDRSKILDFFKENDAFYLGAIGYNEDYQKVTDEHFRIIEAANA